MLLLLQLSILLALHAPTICIGYASLRRMNGLLIIRPSSDRLHSPFLSDSEFSHSSLYGSSSRSSQQRDGPVDEKRIRNPAVAPKKLQVDPLDDDFRSCRVFVSDLPDPCDWKHLKDHFHQYQPIYASVSKDMVTGTEHTLTLAYYQLNSLWFKCIWSGVQARARVVASCSSTPRSERSR